MNGTELWYRKKGFAENPFSIKPAIYSDGLYGHSNTISEVFRAIDSGKIAVVRGDYGNGKSTLLKHLLGRFGGKGKLAYFSCNRPERGLDVKRVLNGRYGFIGKMLDIKPKRMILLLDEAQFLTKQDFNTLMKYYDSGHIKSVVFVAKEQIADSMPERMQRITSLFTFGSVGPDDAVSIVRKRVGKLPLLPDHILKEIFLRSGSNVRVFLKNCDMVCRYAVNKGLDAVSMDVVNMLPSSKAAVKETSKPVAVQEAVKEAVKKPVREEIKEVVKQPVKEAPVVDESVEKEVNDILEAVPAENITEHITDKKPKISSAEELYY